MRKVSDNSSKLKELLNQVNTLLHNDEDLLHRPWWPLTTVDSLFENLRSGYLLCKIVNGIRPETVNMARVRPDASSTTVSIQNLTLGLEGARRLGCRVMNAGAEDFLHTHVRTVSQVLSQLLLSSYALPSAAESKTTSSTATIPTEEVISQQMDLSVLRKELRAVLLENDPLKAELLNVQETALKSPSLDLQDCLRMSQHEILQLRAQLEKARSTPLNTKSLDLEQHLEGTEAQLKRVLTEWHEKEEELTRAVLTSEARRVNAEAELELLNQQNRELQMVILQSSAENQTLQNTLMELRTEVSKMNLKYAHQQNESVLELKQQYDETLKVMKQLYATEETGHRKAVADLSKYMEKDSLNAEALRSLQNELKVKDDALADTLKQKQDGEKRTRQADKSIKMLLSAKERAEVVKEQLQSMYMAFPKHDKAASLIFRNMSAQELEQAPLHRKSGLVKRINKDKTMDTLLVVVQNWAMAYRPDKLDAPFECYHIDGWKVDRTTVPTQHIVTVSCKPNATGEITMIGLELTNSEEQEEWYLVLLKASKWWDEDDNVNRVLEKEKKKTDLVMQKMKVVSLEEAQASRGRPFGITVYAGVPD